MDTVFGKKGLMYRLVVFDLDGTLLDTLADLAFSTNEALEAHGLPGRTIDEVRRFVGNGIRKLIERAVPAGTGIETVDAVFDDFKRSYAIHAADTTHPYPGIPALLKGLRDAGIHCALVSNKADFAVQELVERYFPGQLDIAVGEREGIAKKPAPDMLEHVLAELGVPKDETVYVGDSEVDFATAANTGCDLVLCSWGFRSVEELRALDPARIVGTPEELLATLLG